MVRQIFLMLLGNAGLRVLSQGRSVGIPFQAGDWQGSARERL